MSLEYPGNFKTPAFPAGTRIAISRVMGIGVLSAFLVIGCLCGLLLWGIRSVRLDPFLISVDTVTGAWTVIGRSASYRQSVSTHETMQEAVAGNFFQNWFYISSSRDENDAVWRQCPVAQCTGAETMTYGDRQCAISCGASDKLYSHFVEDVMESYHQRSIEGETWGVMTDTINISKVGQVDAATGGVWRVTATVWSNINAEFNVIAFVHVSRDTSRYPMTLGYYVSDFYAYRIK